MKKLPKEHIRSKAINKGIILSKIDSSQTKEDDS